MRAFVTKKKKRTSHGASNYGIIHSTKKDNLHLNEVSIAKSETRASHEISGARVNLPSH